MAALPPLTLRYSARARSQLLAIHEYITTQGGPGAAGASVPAFGRRPRFYAISPPQAVPGASQREWVVREWPYVIVYEVSNEPNGVMILGIFHCRQSQA